MHSPKLYQLLSAFSKKELRSFRVFLLSSYFNKSPLMVDLFDLIRKCHPDFNSSRLDKEKIFQKLKPTKPFSEKFIVDNFSKLTKLVEQFLAHQELKLDEDLRGMAYQKSLYSHQLSDAFLGELDKKISELDQSSDTSWQIGLQSWQLKQKRFMHPKTEKWQTTKDDSIEIIAHLDEAYIILKLQCELHQKTRGTILTKRNTNLFSEPIINYARSSDHPVIRLYYLLLATFEVTNFEKRWWKANDFYKEHFMLLPFDVKNVGLLALINRGYKLALNGRDIFHATNLDLFKFGLQHEILLTNGLMTPQTFKNISLLGAYNGQFEWTANFIEKYEKFLVTKSNSNIIYFSQAYLSFYRKEYNDCLDWIDKSEILDIREKMNFKSLKLRSWYELYTSDKNLNDFLLNLIKQDHQFLQRIKVDLSPKVIKAYQNFLHLVKLLTKVKHSSTVDRRVSLEKIKGEFAKRQFFMSKQWIEDKIQEI